jgi:1-acyl-sn-glycerol-3-phosphate acyltransferase
MKTQNRVQAEGGQGTGFGNQEEPRPRTPDPCSPSATPEPPNPRTLKSMPNRQSFTWRVAIALLVPLVRWILKLRVLGRENVVPGRGQIIAANHTSQMDPILVGCASGVETWFLAKGELFDFHPAFAWLIRTFNSLPVRRGGMDVAAFKRASEVLQRNRTLVLFPEGTRSKDGPLQPLKAGVAKLAIDNHVPIVPAFIDGVRRSFLPWLVDPDIVKYHRRANPGRLRFRFALLFTSRITVRFGKPLAADGYAQNKTDYLRLTGELERVLQGMADAG